MQISRIDNTVPLSIVRCGSPSRIARPANSEPRPLVISIAANRVPIEVPVSPIPFKYETEKELRLGRRTSEATGARLVRQREPDC
jgi:hypothetical protein